MGLKVAYTEAGQFTITDGETIVKRFPNTRWRDDMEESRHGGDYVEVHAIRILPFDDNDAAAADNDDDEPNASWYVNKTYPGCAKYGYGISWRGYWNRNLEQLDEEFKSVQKHWREGKECAVLIAKLQELKAGNKLPITNVVALGIGSFHNSPTRRDKNKPFEQLAAVLTIRETLGENGKPLPCVIQDPGYSNLDHEYLRTLGLEPVDDPDGFSRINSGSLVFHISTYLFIAWWICDGVWPAAMVCDDWGDCEPYLSKSHPSYCAPSVNAMFQEYEHVPFAGDDADKWEGVNIYWRSSQNGKVVLEGTTS